MKASDLECMRPPAVSSTARPETASRDAQPSSSPQSHPSLASSVTPSSPSVPVSSVSTAAFASSASRSPAEPSEPPPGRAAGQPDTDRGQSPPTATTASWAPPFRQGSLGPTPAATAAAAAAAAVSAAAAATVTATLAGGSDAVLSAAEDVKDGASAAASAISAVLSSGDFDGEAERSAGGRGRSADIDAREQTTHTTLAGDGTDEKTMIACVQRLLEEERLQALEKETQTPGREREANAREGRAAEAAPDPRTPETDQIIKMCDSYYERVLAARDGDKGSDGCAPSAFSSSALGSSFASAVSVTSTLYWRLLLRCELCGEVVAMHKYDAHRRSSCAFRRCRFFPFGCEFVAKVEEPCSAATSSCVSPLPASAPSSLFASSVAPATAPSSSSSSPSSSAQRSSRNALQLRVHEHRCPYRLVKCPCCWKYCTERSSSVVLPLARLATLRASRPGSRQPLPKGPSLPVSTSAAESERGAAVPHLASVDSEEEDVRADAGEDAEGRVVSAGARLDEAESARASSGDPAELHASNRNRIDSSLVPGDLPPRGRELGDARDDRAGADSSAPSQQDLVHLLILQQQDLPREEEADRLWFSVQRDSSSLFASAEVEEVDLADPVGRVVFDDLQGAMDYLLDTEEEIENRIERYGMEPKAFMREQGGLLVCSPDCIVKEPQRLRVELHESLALLGVTWAVGFPLAFLLGAASSFWGQKAAAFMDIAVPYFFSIVSGWLTGFLRQRPAAGFSLQHE
ncbi:conserved hypothetical protein [Neospora caninum Liverpool]|nr:conserved hypothetical protein [Neospora caninum Liverpool]CBZ53407.1 conserved hypothetical protein [Neospora caninum Liverpool]|eukprot:XP_003883439.1 conserved hypothetical protein [Neospora caninum Liverpool]